MAHGAGGKATQSLIEGLLVPAFANETLDPMADAGTVSVLGGEIAMTTDSFVVNPIVVPRRHRSATSPSTARSTTSPWPAPVRWRSRCR